MFSDGMQIAVKAGITAFALAFLLFVGLGAGVAGACIRGAAVALAVIAAVKVIQHLLVHAVVDKLAEFVRKEGERNKTTVDR